VVALAKVEGIGEYLPWDLANEDPNLKCFQPICGIFYVVSLEAGGPRTAWDPR
jgi:hypothetical protein